MNAMHKVKATKQKKTSTTKQAQKQSYNNENKGKKLLMKGDKPLIRGQ
jgi:bifunctional N-acetylglucosamine-1-phosphate-uridyltransferase/glucosamine-1-phosphate-acetyltransferase GlmU-like protein